MTRLIRPLALLAAGLLLVSACGDDGIAASEDASDGAPAEETTDGATGEGAAADEAMADDEEAANDEAAADGDAMGDGAFPIVVESAGGEVAIEAKPERIVSMSSTSTEILFAIGAGGQVEAVDSFSNYPADAPVTDLSAFEPSLEAIAAFEPDLVVLGFGNEEIESGLAGLGIPVLVQNPAASLDDTYDQVAQLGEATGNIDGAASVNSEIRTGIADIVSSLPETTEPVRVYHELDETFFSASSSSFIGQMYEMLGYENIADPADPDGAGFPQLQVDQIIDADPTLIVFTDAYDYGADDIAARPGWDSLSAVANGNIVEVDADISSRWGPRIVDFLQVIAESAAVPTG